MHKWDIFPFSDDLWASDTVKTPHADMRSECLPSPAWLSSQPTAQPQIHPKGVQGSTIAWMAHPRWGAKSRTRIKAQRDQQDLVFTSTIWFSSAPAFTFIILQRRELFVWCRMTDGTTELHSKRVKGTAPKSRCYLQANTAGNSWRTWRARVTLREKN